MSSFKAPAGLGVLGLAIFASMLGVGIIVPFLPVYARSMGATGFMLGLIFSAFAASRALAMPYIGVLSDRHGRKRFITFGLLGYSVIALVMLVADDPWDLIFCRAAMGACSAMVLPISLALVADLSPPGSEGRIFGAFNTSFLLGLGLGPVVGGALYDAQGVESNFLLTSALALVSLILVIWLVKEPPDVVRTKGRTGLRVQWDMVREPGMRALFFCRVGGAASMGCFIAFLPVLGEVKGLSNFQVGVLLAVNVLVMTGLQRPAGWLADTTPRIPLAVAGQAAGAVATIAMPFGAGFEAMLFLAVIGGVAVGMAQPALTALAVSRGRFLGAGMGATMSLFTMALSVGVFSGPLAGGGAVDLWGMGAAFWVGGAAATVGAMVLLLYRGCFTAQPAET